MDNPRLLRIVPIQPVGKPNGLRVQSPAGYSRSETFALSARGFSFVPISE